MIAGGGVAAIEAALAVRELARDRVALTIATEATEFTYRPFAVVRPFQSRPTYRIPLARVAADLGAELVAANAVAVDLDDHGLELSDGRRLTYDSLLIAIGARAEAVVGGSALTPWDWGEGHAFRSMLDAVESRRAASVAFVVPSGLTWQLPLYELALLTSAYIRDRGIADASLAVVTPEEAPLQEFGARASSSVAALLSERGIALHTRSEVQAIEGGTVQTSASVSVPADFVVALPEIRPRPLDGVPTDAAGFVTVDAYCRVTGTADVFAAGDCTDRPVKQGGLAAQQADSAATGIAALAGSSIAARPFRPELRAVLLTGDTPLYLDRTGARPIPPDDPTADPQPAEKIVARHLTSYLAEATPPLPLDAPG